MPGVGTCRQRGLRRRSGARDVTLRRGRPRPLTRSSDLSRGSRLSYVGATKGWRRPWGEGMSAGRRQSNPHRRPCRLIERPRLLKLLDEADARTILLVAPAGYGKTTLARQWAKTLTGTIWVASTPAHRDVVTFSEDVAAGVDALGGSASRFIGEYMRARSNPQRAAVEIAGVLATRVQESGAQWLIVDDYHELAESPEVEEMVAVLRERVTARLLVASR